MAAPSELQEKSWAYDRLRDHWLNARAVIAEGLGHLNVEHYAVNAEDADESCLRFILCGAGCYVAFTHDFETGMLEYGVLDPLSDPPRRIRVADLRFDQQGRLGDNTWLGDKRMIRNAHVSMLNDKAKELVGTYFSAYHGDAGSQETC